MKYPRPLFGIFFLAAVLPALSPAPSPLAGNADAQTFATNEALAGVAARTVQSVVNVSSIRVVDRSGRASPFGRNAPGSRELRGVGSGVIVSADGIIITNYHVVADAAEITVTGAGGLQLPVTVAGIDPLSDLAALRVKGGLGGLKPLPWGSSSALRLGEIVLAVGNPLGLDHTVTMGIVSAKGRAEIGIADYEDFIQTDAAINPGNSGGALINIRGELVGINTAIASETGGSEGIGFAIPSDMARVITESLVKNGKFVRGFLGISIQTLTPELADALGFGPLRGAVLANVTTGGSAARAGLQRYDVVLSIDGRETPTSGEVRNYLSMQGPGKQVTLRIRRNGVERTITATLSALPEPEVQAKPSVLSQEQPDSEGIGLGIIDLDSNARRRFSIPESIGNGVVVVEVATGSRAEDAGFSPGDVIIEAGRKQVVSVAALRTMVNRASGHIPMLIWREGQMFFLVVGKL